MNHLHPFFVIGAPASGTMMLQTALNRHSQITVIPQTKFFTLLQHSRRRQKIHWSRLEDQLKIRLDPPNCRIRAGTEAREHFERIANAYLTRIGCHGITHIGERSPDLQCRIPLILRTFPEARFVLIYRDGRDVALSMTTEAGVRQNLYRHFLTWLSYYRIHRRLLQQEPQRVFCVRYEDLVRNPEAELRLISEFLGIDYEPCIIEGSDGRRGNPGCELSFTNDVREATAAAAAAAASGCWRSDLSLTELAYLERWGGWALRELHYECATEMRTLPLWQIPFIYGRFALESTVKMISATDNYSDVSGVTATGYGCDNGRNRLCQGITPAE